MLELLGHILMAVGATIAILSVITIWVIGIIAINDIAVHPLFRDAQNHPLIRSITRKIEEYRNAERP